MKKISKKAKLMEATENDEPVEEPSKSKPSLDIIDVAKHRNGIAGSPFDVVLFKDEDELMVGIVFPQKGHVAVLSVDKLKKKIVAMGRNSYRGDFYEPDLRKAVRSL